MVPVLPPFLLSLLTSSKDKRPSWSSKSLASRSCFSGPCNPGLGTRLVGCCGNGREVMAEGVGGGEARAMEGRGLSCCLRTTWDEGWERRKGER